MDLGLTKKPTKPNLKFHEYTNQIKEHNYLEQ